LLVKFRVQDASSAIDYTKLTITSILPGVARQISKQILLNWKPNKANLAHIPSSA